MHTGVTVKVGHKPRKLVMESKSGSLGYVFSCGLRTSFQPFHKYARTPSGVAAFAPGLGDSAENAPGKIPALEEIRNESHDYPHRVAKFPENRNRNRYRDVSPYDHSRVKLQNAENDYINASLVDIEEAQRSYILTQGPLPNTCCHFWLMVWQQKTKAVVMLNRIVEKESVKCAQYWPTDDQEMLFKETGFSVKLLSEDVKSYYTVHLLQLENINSGETRTISHFHYTTWPDFGVPESPASFLNFLFKVRESGSLNPDHGPAVIHCSAGIGRSGTFSLVDTCLVLMEKGDDINIKQVLLNMRKYRMGLIQTPDQLRFSYMAIIEGAKCIKGDSSIQKRWKELSKEDLSPAFDHSPNKIMTEKYNGNRIGLEEEKLTGDRCTGLSSKMQDTMEENSESALRKRIREDRKATTAQKVQQMKQRLNENERKRKRWLYWQPILTKMGFMSVILVGAFVGWTLFFQQNAL
ncbi:tyrosine-protein phosphatase non-receptor type 2 isoform X4 [Gorilla gorilla gorilla]|nr:tyrosine-protein phosphatase non-receptor type 2 isoform X3 [Gorilla gorilla gorilla]